MVKINLAPERKKTKKANLLLLTMVFLALAFVFEARASKESKGLVDEYSVLTSAVDGGLFLLQNEREESKDEKLSDDYQACLKYQQQNVLAFLADPRLTNFHQKEMDVVIDLKGELEGQNSSLRSWHSDKDNKRSFHFEVKLDDCLSVTKFDLLQAYFQKTSAAL